MLAPMRMRPRPRSISSRLLSAVASSCGVSVPRTSARVAKALTISDTGELTFLACPSACHWLRMDSESLPTGIDTPSAGHSSNPTAWTVA